MTDVILAGGGLANSLIAYRLKRLRPQLNILILERGAKLGGNHTWSFHSSDLDSRQQDWISPFVTRSWKDYQVKFPELDRVLHSGYHSIRSEDLHRVMSDALQGSIRTEAEIVRLESHQVTLSTGETLSAPCVIDGRGMSAPLSGDCAYQKFVGWDVTLAQPHGLRRPILMDATVEQVDGYRFFYVLPWDENRLLIEDTRYSDHAGLDPDELRSAIQDYADRKGWVIAQREREEIGVLPIPLDRGFREIRAQWIPELAPAGMRAGLFHCTTGYSLPLAARLADLIASIPQLESRSLAKVLRSVARDHWQDGAFFRLLNRMLFRAVDSKNRFKILQHFYEHSEPLIERFYAGKLTSWDRMMILGKRPPVALDRAIRCVFSQERGLL